jgi:hypothetical protein
MSFFDSKKEVLDVVLTEYGRKLLSQGKMKPKFYAFFDDDIIYDSTYANLTESQSEIQPRILEEVPYLKLYNLTISGSEQSVRINDNEVKKLNYSLGLPIGFSDPNTDYSPSWNVNCLKGNIYSVSSSSLWTNKDYIPQISMSYQHVEISLIKNPLEIPVGFNTYPITQRYPEGTFVAKINEYIYDFIEQNTIDQKENFEIEIFEIEKDNLRPLKFIRKAKEIKDGILLDKPEDGLTQEEINSLRMSDLNEDFAESYFKILVDEEIPFDSLKIERLDIYSKDVNKLKPNKDNC